MAAPRRSYRFCLAALLAAAACSSPAVPPAGAPPEARPVPGASLDAPCGEQALGVAFADSGEIAAFAQSRGEVVRTGCRLTFRDTGGAYLHLDDVREEGSAWILHRYRGYLEALGAHVVQVGFYEGGNYRLVYPGGAQVTVAGWPVPSPDGARFVAWSMDLVAEYDPNVIQVWRRTPAAARLELAIESGLWGPGDVRWVDSATIAFQQHFPLADPEETDRRAAQLQLRDGRWIALLHTR